MLLPFRMRAKERKESWNIFFIGGKTLHPILQTLQHVSFAAFLMYVGNIHDQFLNFSKISFGKLLTHFSNSSKGKKKNLKSIMAIYQDEITCIEYSSNCTPRRKGQNIPIYKEKGKCYTSYQFYPSLSRQWLYKLWSSSTNGMELIYFFLKPFLWFATIFISLLLDPDAEYFISFLWEGGKKKNWKG